MFSESEKFLSANNFATKKSDLEKQPLNHTFVVSILLGFTLFRLMEWRLTITGQ